MIKKMLLLLVGWGIMGIYCLQAQNLNDELVFQQGDKTSSQLISLKELLVQLEKTYNMTIIYKSDLVEDKYVSASKMRADDFQTAMKQILQAANLDYKQVGARSYILLAQKISFPKVVQQQTVTGSVTDTNSGETIPGANILVKGTTTGTSTDDEGHFALTVPSLQDTLVVSFVGYQTREVPINGRSEIDISLKSQAISGKEMVVIGYGTQKQENVTASISTADIGNVSSQHVSNVEGALQGQVAGMDIQRSGGQPGKDLTIRIRGRRSINAGNDPLIVVDEIPFGGSLSDISTQNIKSISILKDAAATAIYGSRGANGVILITTKNGGRHGTEISYSGYYGITEPVRTADMMNGQEFAAYKRESRRSMVDENGNTIYSWKGSIPPDEDVFKVKELEGLKEGVSTDWQNLVLHSGNRQNHHLSIGGGDKNTQVFVSGNYLDEKALIPTNGFTRYGLRVNVKHQIGDNFRMGVSSLLSRYIRDWDTNPMAEALQESPLGKPYDKNGNLVFLPVADGLVSNPLLNLKPGAQKDSRRFNQVFASIYAELDLLDNLTYRINFGPSYRSRRRGTFLGSMTNQQRGAPPTAGEENDHIFDYTLQNRLNYNTSFGDSDHNLKVTVLQSIENHNYESDNIDVRGLPFESQKFHNLSTASTIDGVDSDLNQWQLASFLGRINYNYKGKYLLQLSGRADGSSRLAEDNKWSIFPGASIGWRITNEPFMNGGSLLSNLKVRASYGVVGNTAIDPYQTKGRLARTTYAFGENAAYGYRLDEIANQNLGWEKTSTFDTGVDFSILGDRISGSVDYYISHTNDLLLNRQLPYTSGYDQILQNVGKTKNTGVEASLKSVNFEANTNDGFTWSTNLNWSHYNEEILKLFNKTQDDVGSRWFIGYPINVFYNYKKIGIWQKDEAQKAAKYDQRPGQIKVKDQNGDGKINGKDRVILGSDVPDWSGGMTNRFAYKGFDLSVLIFARVGQMIRSRYHYDYVTNALFGRYNNIDVDYWTPNNPTNDYPRPYKAQQEPVYSSSAAYFNGSYLKIKNITMGYNLPVSLVGNLGVNKFRIYATVENAFVFSPYKFSSPETQSNITTPSQSKSDIFQQGVGSASKPLPLSRLYSVGINIRF